MTSVLNRNSSQKAATRRATDSIVVVPADLATIYNFNPLFNAGVSGQGQPITLVEDSDLYTNDDWSNFRSTLGLSNYVGASLTTIYPNNCTDPGINADDGEAILDAEWASAAAPSAAIVIASCTDLWTAVQNLVNEANPPPIVSISYGVCEALSGSGTNALTASIYQQAVAEGVSVFVSAGDNDGAVCTDRDNSASATTGIGVNALASTPYNVAVGGTDFSDSFSGTSATYWAPSNGPTYGSALSYVPEIPWNRFLRRPVACDISRLHRLLRCLGGLQYQSRHQLVDDCRGQRRSQRVCHGSAVHGRRRQRHLSGLSKAVLANGRDRHPER